ncbi:MAG: hypothetical protein RBT62_07800 [Spirochaetia bacterium]|nr:hypothetical protein [Spirochaetia bacterium]
MKRLALALLIGAALSPLVTRTAISCDEYYSDHGFSIDLPPGFEYIEGDGSTKFSFGSPDGQVRVDILAYPQDRFTDAKSGALDTTRRLSGRGNFHQFEYDSLEAAFGELSFGDGQSALKGYGLFINDARTPDEGSPYDLAVLSYTLLENFDALGDVVASAIDGFSPRFNHRAIPGPLGTASRALLGPNRLQKGSIQFGKAVLDVSWNPEEADVSQNLVEREYRVLCAYADTPLLVEEAMARFYRMVFRDAAPSLDRLALQMSAAWETGAWAGLTPASMLSTEGSVSTATSAGPRFGAPAQSREYASALLSWVQAFKYVRDPQGSDVVNSISAAFEGRGDCDSRALVLAILLRRENIESILMISLKHEHALAGIDAPGAGARFPYGDKLWLVAETTARVGIGLIDAGQSDPAAWIGIAFPR